MSIDLLSLLIELPGCASLKEKRSRLKPLLGRLHQEFNISAAEIDHLDLWKTSIIACVMVSNDAQHNQRVLAQVVTYIEENFSDLFIQRYRIERV